MLYSFPLADISLCMDTEQVSGCVFVGRSGGEKKTVTSLYRSTEKDFVQLPKYIA